MFQVLSHGEVVMCNAAGINPSIFTTWTVLFSSKPMATGEELPARKMFTAEQRETLTVPCF